MSTSLSLGARGFRIDGAAANNFAGFSVAGAGDVNGDGIDDVIVGAYQAANNSRTTSGSAYVVYGGATPAGVDLASLGARGFRIDGAVTGDQAGFSVAGAGDVNGDGVDDVIVGADLADNNGRSGSGSAYLVAGGVGGIAAADTATVAEDSGATTIDVLANDTGISKKITAVGTPGHGSAAITHSGADLTYTPAANYCGSDSFTYTLDSGSQATVSVTVTCVNDAPVAGDDTGSVNEDATLSANVLSNDTDADGDPLTAIKLTDPAHGDLTFSADGSYTYVPHANYHGSDSFTYKANDGHADSNVATVSITVNSVNDAPVAGDDADTTAEDTALNGSSVLANDSDVDGDTLTASLVAGPAHSSSFVLRSDGTYSYTPAANYHGSDSFTYKANDGTADSNTATVSIAVSSVNYAPVAGDDTGTVNEDATLSANVLSNDTDADNDPLTAIKLTRSRARRFDVQRRRFVHLRPARQLPRRRLVHLQGERRHRRLEHGYGDADRQRGERRSGRGRRQRLRGRGRHAERERARE